VSQIIVVFIHSIEIQSGDPRYVVVRVSFCIEQGCKNITFSATLPPDAGRGRFAQDDGKELMPYRERPLGGRLSSTWLVLVVGLWIFFAILIFSESVAIAAIATVILVAATPLFLEIRRRRAVWKRLQWQQKRRRRFEERTRRVGETSNDGQPRPWWQVLEIAQPSTADDVKAAYRAKIKQFHPDTVIGLAKEFQELAERKTKEINQAYREACRSPSVSTRRDNQQEHDPRPRRPL
jgi:DnaJ domain